MHIVSAISVMGRFRLSEAIAVENINTPFLPWSRKRPLILATDHSSRCLLSKLQTTNTFLCSATLGERKATIRLGFDRPMLCTRFRKFCRYMPYSRACLFGNDAGKRWNGARCCTRVQQEEGLKA